MRCLGNGYNPEPMKFDYGVHRCGGSHGYRTYKAQLDPLMLEDLFEGELQQWNQRYANAQKIFGDGCQAAMARQMIRQQNNWAYGGAVQDSLTFAPRSCRNTTTGEELLELINYGKLANDETTFFTYVLLEDGSWRFSHTGSTFLRDYVSKHAMHSNVSPFVVYAGEFHVRQEDNGSYTVVVDNNSGTYAPDNAQLPAMAEALRQAFPGLQVTTLEARLADGRQNPDLDAAIEACPSRRT